YRRPAGYTILHVTSVLGSAAWDDGVAEPLGTADRRLASSFLRRLAVGRQNAYRYPLCVRRAAPVPGGAASGLPRFTADLRAGAEGRLGRLGARSTLRDDGRRNDRDRASASDPLSSRGPGIQAAGGTSAALVRCPPTRRPP